MATAACEDAIARALSALALDGPALGRFGFDAAWRDALLHRRGHMVQPQLGLYERRATAAGDAAARRRLVEEGRRLWGRLALSARLAQLSGGITRGRAPEGAEALLAARREAGARAEVHVGALARRGFGEEEHAALRTIVARLAAAPIVATRPAGEEESGALQVLRGAILGDIALLCQAAKEVLPRPQLQALRLRRALLLRG